jgi:hypothetical protein
VSSDQLIVLVLLAAAFAAGWFARGGRVDRSSGASKRPAAPRSKGPDPLVAHADDALARALTAARAARSVVLGPAGANDAARASVLRILDQRLVELEDCSDQLESSRGPDDEAFAAFDRAVSGMAAVRRRITDDADLDGVEAAREAWERVARQG